MLLRDILAADDPQILAIRQIIDQVAPDVLVLTDFDFDASNAALSAFSQSLNSPYPYLFSRRPNAGLQTGLDLDGNGYAGDARDAMGYGRFLGDGGMAILSRYPIQDANVTDLTQLLWRDLEGATLPQKEGAPFPSTQARSIQRLSSVGHWIVPLEVDETQVITLLAYAATPPVFDGPEDANGLRNRDELRLWENVLEGRIGPVPEVPIVIGNTNLDPFDGQGERAAMVDFLAHRDLQDPTPRSAGGVVAATEGHLGDPALDTAAWPRDEPGNLRVSYVLPSSKLTVTGAGVFWPAPDDPLAVLLGSDGQAAGPHRLVWVDVSW